MVGRLGLFVLAVGVLLAGCSGSSPGKSAAGRPTPVPIPAQCAVWSCQKVQSVAVPGAYTASVWHAGQLGDFTTHPVIELSHDGISVQWWVLPNGYGWSGTLTCLSDTDRQPPDCVFVDGQGVHSGLAQAMVLRAGRLVPAGTASSDTAMIIARDVDGDGQLDLIAQDSDYNPNFASGHLFWRTYRFTGEQLVSTGCTPASSIKQPPPPTQFAMGVCARR